MIIVDEERASDSPFVERIWHHGAEALAQVLPHASRHTLEGQTHTVDPNVLAPVLIEFFQQ